MKKAIILAAGVGSRIKKYHEKPKALLEFGKNKITIIERLYRILKKKNFSKIVVITGFRDKLLSEENAQKPVHCLIETKIPGALQQTGSQPKRSLRIAQDVVRSPSER